MLAEIADVVETAGLQIGTGRPDLGQGRLAENLRSDVLDRAVRDFMDKADVPVFARGDPGDDLAPCDFRVDDGLAAAAAVVDHDDEVLHAWRSHLIPYVGDEDSISENRKLVKYKFGKTEI